MVRETGAEAGIAFDGDSDRMVSVDLDSEGASMFESELARIVGEGSRFSSEYGLRAASGESWVLVRKSGTEPKIRVTVESKTWSEMDRIMKETIHLTQRLSRSG